MGVLMIRPGKPTKDFPLFPHADGTWKKKIEGRQISFGGWREDPRGERALEKYRTFRDRLANAGGAEAVARDELTVRELCNLYFTFQHKRYERGEIEVSTIAQYRRMIENFTKGMGRHRVISTLSPDDFARHRNDMHRRGNRALDLHIMFVRAMFDWAYQNEKIENPARFGSSFNKVGAVVHRRKRAKHANEHGARVFSPEECRVLVEKSSGALKAMILLALNGGMGNVDIGTLPRSAIDGKVIDLARSKTGIARVIPLWEETVKALAEVPNPSNAKGRKSGLVFTTPTGRPMVRDNPVFDDKGKVKSSTRIDQVSALFEELLDLEDVKLRRDMRGFNSLRASFRTFSVGAKQPEAVKVIMGHRHAGLDEFYVRGVDPVILRSVVDHVHSKIFKPPHTPQTQPTTSPPSPAVPPALAKARAHRPKSR